MPLYEYTCHDCSSRFDTFRSMKDADALIQCKHCFSPNTKRALSLFFASSDRGTITSSSGGCTSCSGGSCTSCTH